MLYKFISFGVRKRSAAIHGFYAFLLILVASQSALAAFTDDLGIGNAKALALGNAVTADPPNIDSVHFNPAGIIRLDGRQLFIKGVYGVFSQTYEFGEYGDYQKNLIKKYSSYTPEYVDENGNLTDAGKAFYYDEALNSKSKVEGPTVMLPGGMTNPAFAGGVMGGASYKPDGSSFAFATNVYAPMMYGGYRDEEDPGRFVQRQGAFSLLTYFSPTVAFEVSDELQVGMSVNFNYSGMGLDLPVRVPNEVLFFYGTPFFRDNFCTPDGTPTTPIDLCTHLEPYSTLTRLKFEADQNLVLGYNLGLLWSPEPWLTFGLAYNSAIHTDMDGEYYFPIAPKVEKLLMGLATGDLYPALSVIAKSQGLLLPSAEEISNQGTGNINVSYELPQRVNAGVSVMMTPKWKVNMDLKWTEWSAFSSIALKFDEEIPLLMLGYTVDQVTAGGENGIHADHINYNFGLQDVGYWALGTEYQYTDNLALRAGFEYRPSAVPKDQPNALIPLNDANLISMGFAYRLQSDNNIDFAIGYMNSKSHWPPCTAKLGNACDYKVMVSPVYQGQDMKAQVSFLLFELTYSMYF